MVSLCEVGAAGLEVRAYTFQCISETTTLPIYARRQEEFYAIRQPGGGGGINASGSMTQVHTVG